MHTRDSLSELDTFAERLSFSPTDFARVNEMFSRWWTGDAPEYGPHLELWCYWFIHRYFALRFAFNPVCSPSDEDATVERVSAKVERGMRYIRYPERFTHWLSVVCRHSYLHYKQSPAYTEALADDDDDSFLPSEWQPEEHLDKESDKRALFAAIQRIAPFTRQVAMLRFMEGQSFGEIAERLGLPISLVYTYASKAGARLRECKALRARALGEGDAALDKSFN